MLFVYGKYMPLRLLEEIKFWKTQEKEHTVVIREITPMLEPQYVAMLQAWEPVFARTEYIAEKLLHAALACPGDLSPAIAEGANCLLRVSAAQSQTFVAQLTELLAVSPAVAGNPFVVTVVRHIIRESEYFLCVLAALLEPREDQEAELPDAQAKNAPDTEDTRAESASVDGGKTEGGFEAREGEAAAHARGAGPHPRAGEATQTGSAGAVAGSSAPHPDSAGIGGSGAASHPEQARSGAFASVPIGGHTLPPLPYAYNALEPHIDAMTMRIHHEVHHKSYVDGLNKAEKELQKARQTNDFSLVKHWERELAFNGAGHYLHTLFWNVMSPRGGGPAIGPLAQQIQKDFGSYEAFKKQFSQAAEKVEGGGWAILVWSPRSRRLEILTAEKHQNLSQWDVVPVLPLDVWEHAYYLKHQSKRADYIKDWWSVVNWPYANDRFAEAGKLVWKPY